jgi:hypothetical protein
METAMPLETRSEMISEEEIRLRSYLIWQREGCPEGHSLDHWLRAKAELNEEVHTLVFRRDRLQSRVAPRLPISVPPRKSVAANAGQFPARISAAR